MLVKEKILCAAADIQPGPVRSFRVLFHQVEGVVFRTPDILPLTENPIKLGAEVPLVKDRFQVYHAAEGSRSGKAFLQLIYAREELNGD